MREARFIPLTPVAAPPAPEGIVVHALPEPVEGRPGALLDALSRPLNDLRISVTDRCNFRCSYCMPRETFGPGHRFLPQPALLTFDEIERSARLLVQLGVRKIRLTGGEPLLRKQLEVLVERLARLQTPDGRAVELTLTTNATLLAAKARALRDAGLQRITVSLDALDDATFQRMNDAGVSVGKVMEGLAAAQAVGLGPIKVNMVVQRGVNDHEILPMVRHFRNTGIELRFIEYMDVGATNGWQLHHVLPSNEVRERIAQEFPLLQAPSRHAGETAERWLLADGSGSIGLISSVTQAFCGDCNRLRLSTDGRLFTCLFAREGHDLRAALRGAEDDDTLERRLAALWQSRRDRYSQLRGQLPPDTGDGTGFGRRVEMSYIGG